MNAPNLPTPGTPLSRRETAVLTLAAAGWSNQAIASAHFVSLNTIKTTLRRAYHRLGASGRTHGCALAICASYINPTGAPPSPRKRPTRRT